jgi:hypothetical protein
MVFRLRDVDCNFLFAQEIYQWGNVEKKVMNLEVPERRFLDCP